MKKPEWKLLKDELPKDEQEIIVYDEGLKKELKRTFHKDFWDDNKRVLWCSGFCKKWKPALETLS